MTNCQSCSQMLTRVSELPPRTDMTVRESIIWHGAARIPSIHLSLLSESHMSEITSGYPPQTLSESNIHRMLYQYTPPKWKLSESANSRVSDYHMKTKVVGKSPIFLHVFVWIPQAGRTSNLKICIQEGCIQIREVQHTPAGLENLLVANFRWMSPPTR